MKKCSTRPETVLPSCRPRAKALPGNIEICSFLSWQALVRSSAAPAPDRRPCPKHVRSSSVGPVALPCYTTLCRRPKGLGVDLDIPRRSGPIHIAIDSTGLKVFGDGEWKARQHGTSKRRTWRKVHVALDPKEMIVHEVLLTTIPPRQDAVCHPHEPEMRDRNAALEEINKVPDKGEGRKAWKSSKGYHQRSKIETQMYRMKRVFGGALKARGLESQATEIPIRCRILNRATSLGLSRRSHAA